ncbi:MAG: hypothetical protein ACREDR_41065 [Blastocatellia bacterium]
MAQPVRLNARAYWRHVPSALRFLEGQSIYGARDALSYIHVQDYNSGTMYGLDGAIYAEGTADFHVAMTEMLLRGFQVAGDRRNLFPALRPDQVALGVPASPGATGSGFTRHSDLRNALNYLVRGISFGGKYKLQNPAGYPGLRGLMTFSINRDVAAGRALSKSIEPLLEGYDRAR